MCAGGGRRRAEEDARRAREQQAAAARKRQREIDASNAQQRREEQARLAGLGDTDAEGQDVAADTLGQGGVRRRGLRGQRRSIV